MQIRVTGILAFQLPLLLLQIFLDALVLWIFPLANPTVIHSVPGSVPLSVVCNISKLGRVATCPIPWGQSSESNHQRSALSLVQVIAEFVPRPAGWV